MRQRVTFIRPTTVFSATTGREFTVKADTWADVERGGGPVTGRNCWYKPYIEGRDRHGYEPYVRVDRLHRATEHAEPFYRGCDHCHGLGTTQNVRLPGVRGYHFVPEPVSCPGCSGRGYAKEYPGTGRTA